MTIIMAPRTYRPFGLRKASQPPAAPASSHHATRGEARADQHIGGALRAEERHAVDQLAEYHLDGPRQAEPDANPGEFGGRQRQMLLDPKVARDIDQAERAIGEIHHHQRHVAETERQDRTQQAVDPGRASG